MPCPAEFVHPLTVICQESSSMPPCPPPGTRVWLRVAGDGATAFAVSLGFTEETLQTPQSLATYQAWVNDSCQPNYWQVRRGRRSPECVCGC